jgi:tripartite-type tricarboxylate transporter receptor subunit TctC
MANLVKFFAGLLLVLGLGAGSAGAQENYPNRTIKIIVPTSPGATTDILARALGQIFTKKWGQSVVIENRTGGSEMLGVEAVVKSPADGYTLVLTSNSSITAAPFLYRQMRYDPQKDLTPLAMLGWITPVMLVPASSPVRTVQDLIALAKSKPGELNYGSFGVGTYSHIAMEEFKRRTGTQMLHLAYKGATPAYTALLRNEIAVMLSNLSSAAAHEEAGHARIIAAATLKRAKARPDLPTIAESGLPGFTTGAWWGLFGPANLPPAIADKIRTEVDEALDTPEMKRLYKTNTNEVEKMTHDQFVRFIAEDLENSGREIKGAGIKPQ